MFTKHDLDQLYIPEGMIQPPLTTDQSWHRKELKEQLLWKRDRVCRGCGCIWGKATAIHMHEGIISKRDVQGWQPPSWRGQINIEANTILLCHDCNLGLHGKNPPPREQVLREQVGIYGPDVIKWLASLPFKSHPLRGLLEQYPEP